MIERLEELLALFGEPHVEGAELTRRRQRVSNADQTVGVREVVQDRRRDLFVVNESDAVLQFSDVQILKLLQRTHLPLRLTRGVRALAVYESAHVAVEHQRRQLKV